MAGTIGFSMANIKYYLVVDQQDQTKVVSTEMSHGIPNYYTLSRSVSFDIYEKAREALASQVYTVQYVNQDLVLTLNLGPYKQTCKDRIEGLYSQWYNKPFNSEVQGLVIPTCQLLALTIAASLGQTMTVDMSTGTSNGKQIGPVTAKMVANKYVAACSSLVDAKIMALFEIEQAETKEQLDNIVSEFADLI